MHHYCKRVIAGKKSLKTEPCQRYKVTGPQVTPMDSVTLRVPFNNKGKEGLHAFLKILLHKHNLLSERLARKAASAKCRFIVTTWKDNPQGTFLNTI